MAKAAAHYTGSVFVAASGSEFVEMYVGVGAGRVRDLFKDARTRALKENKQSAIIFIDEIDVIGGKREGGQQREYDQTLNQLLTEMDGIYNNDTPRILLVAATNRKEMLDSALLRRGVLTAIFRWICLTRRAASRFSTCMPRTSRCMIPWIWIKSPKKLTASRVLSWRA